MGTKIAPGSNSGGDVAGAILAVKPGKGVDLLYGVGGTPEGVIAASALKCLGGEMKGRLYPRDGARGRPDDDPLATLDYSV